MPAQILPDRPNILLILTDQQSACAMSCAGHRDLSTPAMDSLAAEGVRCDRAYCQFPLCLPTRTSMFTGRMPHEFGITDNHGHITEEAAAASWSRQLREAGYEMAYGGKTHIAGLPDQQSIYQTLGFEKISDWNDGPLADDCAEFFRREHQQPFCLVASYDNPHNVCEAARHQRLPYGPVPEAALADCPNLPANFAPPSYEPTCIRWLQQSNPVVHPTFGWTEDDWRHFRHVYFRLVEKVDGEIGRLLAALRESGLDDNTLIVFTSDHGDAHGAHQLNQKSFLYDEVVRVPFIVRPPGGRAPATSQALVHAATDLHFTMLDAAGLEVPRDPRGRSVLPLLADPAPADWRRAAFGESTIYGNCDSRFVRTQRYAYNLYLWGKNREQLFDLEADPGEMVNLAVESRYAEILQQHRDLLADWFEDTGDRLNTRWGIGPYHYGSGYGR